MARWGNCNYKQLQKLRKNIEKLQSVDMDVFCREVSKELARKLLSLVVKATPIGEYPESTGKKGGTLRRGWTGGRRNSSIKDYANSLPISKSGYNYTITIINPVEYASYVEFGHRTPSGKGWVPGQYFLTLSEAELERKAPSIIEKNLEKLLRDIFSV